MEDTESLARDLVGHGSVGYSGLDPMEDTERASSARATARIWLVTVGSIRWRILKERLQQQALLLRFGYSGLDPMEDTESADDYIENAAAADGYSGLDPMEDTESSTMLASVEGTLGVTVGSIRWRILKV